MKDLDRAALKNALADMEDVVTSVIMEQHAEVQQCRRELEQMREALAAEAQAAASARQRVAVLEEALKRPRDDESEEARQQAVTESQALVLRLTRLCVETLGAVWNDKLAGSPRHLGAPRRNPDVPPHGAADLW